MFGMANLDKIVSDISSQSGSSKDKVESLIEDKIAEFSGMITKEAAAHLVAKEMGLRLETSHNGRFQIKNIVSGMRNVAFTARIFKISPINEFQKKNGEKGRVVNVFLSDGTGYIRVPLWNDQVKIVEDEEVKVGDVVHVFGGMSRENIYGEIEISLGKFGGMRKSDDVDIPSLESIGKGFLENTRTKIENLVPGTFEVRATIVQIFKGNFVFENDVGEKSMFFSCLLDDGTADIRAVFFKSLAEQLSGLTASDIETLSPDARLEAVSKRVLGREVIVSGKVKKNKLFDRLEMIADSVKDINPIEESKRLVEEIEVRIGA
jgi:ssDNA-binding replication factor A large subunit